MKKLLQLGCVVVEKHRKQRLLCGKPFQFVTLSQYVFVKILNRLLLNSFCGWEQQRHELFHKIIVAIGKASNCVLEQWNSINSEERLHVKIHFSVKIAKANQNSLVQHELSQ